MELKPLVFWVIGALLLLAGTWIIGNVELTVGVAEVSYILAVVASLVLFLLAGLCWISVAVATKK